MTGLVGRIRRMRPAEDVKRVNAPFSARRLHLHAASGCVLLALVALIALPATVAAQEPEEKDAAPLTIESVDIGFNAQYKVGAWTPVRVTLKGGKDTHVGYVQLVVPDGDGVPSRVTSQKPYQVTAGRTVVVPMLVRFGRIESQLRVSFVEKPGTAPLAAKTYDPSSMDDKRQISTALYASQELYVTIGKSIGVTTAVDTVRAGSEEKAVVASLDSTDQLPTRWSGYEGVTALILSTSDLDPYSKLQSGGEQLEALEEWVRMGGKLVICAGSQASQVLNPENPLARFVPAKLQEVTGLSNAADLEAYAEAKDPIQPPGSDEELRLTVPRLKDLRLFGAKVLVPSNEASDLPLVVRAANGFGDVTFVGVDLDLPPFTVWKSRDAFVAKLLGRPFKATESKQPPRGGAVANTGITDLSGQLRGALDQFAGVSLVPFSVVAGLVFLYILLIGPGDYFFVKLVLKRMEMTWITFPLVVVLVSLGAYQLAYWLKGDQLRVNQVDLVDVDLDTNLVRGTMWTNIFTPRAESYDLTAQPVLPGGKQPDAGETQVIFSWLGLPSKALGGMHQETDNAPLFNRPYDFSPPLSEMLRMPTQVWSTRSLTARWTCPDDDSLETIDLKIGDNKALEGKLVSRLGVPLTNCWLAYDKWLYLLGEIKDGEEIDLAPRWKEREVLLSNLTSNRLEYDAQKKQHSMVTSEYDTESFDVPMILRQMMFNKASGGEAYAELHNLYQSFVDLSDHLKLNRAILVGFAERPGSLLERKQADGTTVKLSGPEVKRWTCYRFVIPLEYAK